MERARKHVEDVLCIKIKGGITQEHVELAIERCEEILMGIDSQYIYGIMEELERLLK